MTELNDISDLFNFPLYYEDEQNHSVDASLPAPPPALQPYTYSPESTPTDPIDFSSPNLSEDDDAHLRNLLWFGVDSAVFSPPTPTHMAEYPTILAPLPPPFASSPTLTDVSSPSTDPDPGPASPPTSATSPVASSPPQSRKRRRSLTEDLDTPQPGPSSPNPRPATRPRLTVLTVVPGESVFQLDVQVPAFTPNISSGAPMGKTRQRVDYSACKCPNKSKKPARHWKTACPYNTSRSENRFTCELCGETFSRHDNKDRHIEDFHP